MILLQADFSLTGHDISTSKRTSELQVIPQYVQFTGTMAICNSHWLREFPS